MLKYCLVTFLALCATPILSSDFRPPYEIPYHPSVPVDAVFCSDVAVQCFEHVGYEVVVSDKPYIYIPETGQFVSEGRSYASLLAAYIIATPNYSAPVVAADKAPPSSSGANFPLGAGGGSVASLASTARAPAHPLSTFDAKDHKSRDINDQMSSLAISSPPRERASSKERLDREENEARAQYEMAMFKLELAMANAKNPRGGENTEQLELAVVLAESSVTATIEKLNSISRERK